jgi:CheY-like chemotaxis protein
MKPLALVLEHDGGTRRLLQVLLTRAGLEVDLVSNGDDAMPLLENVSYELLFIDLQASGTSGEQILRWLAVNQPEMLTRATALSTAPLAQLASVREKWPMVSVLSKPFELSEIMTRTEQVATQPVRSSEQDPYAQFCRRSVRAGARAGVLLRVKGTQLEATAAFGYTPEQLAGYLAIPTEAPYPLCESARSQRPVWIQSVTASSQQYPSLAGILRKNGTRALAAVPMLHEGSVIGVAGWSFREPHLFTEAERNAFVAIADSVAPLLPALSQQSFSGGGA